MGAIRWGTRGTRPPTFSGSGDIICHFPHILFLRLNILVSHQPAPPHILQQNCVHGGRKAGIYCILRNRWKKLRGGFGTSKHRGKALVTRTYVWQKFNEKRLLNTWQHCVSSTYLLKQVFTRRLYLLSNQRTRKREPTATKILIRHFAEWLPLGTLHACSTFNDFHKRVNNSDYLTSWKQC